jgi:hypothetical protein
MTDSKPMTVADLTADHRGWMIRVEEPDPVFRHREFVLLSIRGPWTVDGVTRVGLLAPADPPWAGQEHIYPADTPCQVLRQVRRARKRRAGR